MTQRNLLKDQAIGPDFNVRMDNNAIGMRNEQTSTKP